MKELLLPIIFISAFILQALFAYKQSKEVGNVYKELVDKYKGMEGYYIGYGKHASSLRNWKKGNLALVVINDQSTIEEVIIMKGITVFAKFKEVSQYKGETIARFKEETIKNKALQKAINNIENLKSGIKI